MKSIRTSDLKDGMKYDKPVYMDGENVFVPAGVPIRQKDIERLRRWDVEAVRTDGSLVVDKPAGEPQAFDASMLKNMPAADRQNLDAYMRAIDEYEHVTGAVSRGEEIERQRIDGIVGGLLERVKAAPREMIQLILMGGRIERKIAASVINCTILSAVMGAELKYTSHRLIQLATGALLHDIGMVKVPKSILKKQEKLSDDEFNQIRTHPLQSYRIVAKDLKYPEDIAIIALQHHERWDGKGYPRKVRGEDINLSARIVAVADSYVAMISNRPHRSSVIFYNAMRQIQSGVGTYFDPKIIKVFVASMGIYPIGSIVQLSTSAIGRVAKTHADAPLRPVVELIIDEYGNKVTEGDVIDLLAKKGLFIVKALDPGAFGPAAKGAAPA